MLRLRERYIAGTAAASPSKADAQLELRVRRSWRAQVKRLAWRVVDLPADARALASRSNRRLVPRPSLRRFVGVADYEAIGDEFLGHLVAAGLEPHHDVLDVGCGIGRMARPLVSYLDGGSYAGFDVVPHGIRWCRQHITRRATNFRFTLADVRYSLEENRGVSPAVYRFPYGDDSFDLVFATSVLTHMQPEAFRNYVAEMGRVARPGGRVFVTVFIVRSSTPGILQPGRSIPVVDTGQGWWTADVEQPEKAIGYLESWVEGVLADAGLELAAPVAYGAWDGASEPLTYQDVVVGVKPASAETYT